METGAKGAGPGPSALDALVPPPWSGARRAAAWVLAAGLAVLLGAAWWAGLLGPRLEHPGSWGSGVHMRAAGALEVDYEVPVRNAGRLPVEIRAFVPPPGLEGVSFGTVQPGLPITVAPGDTLTLDLTFTVTGCDIDAGGLDFYPILARSGWLPARTVDVPHPGLDLHPMSMEQEPSWILTAIAVACAENGL